MSGRALIVDDEYAARETLKKLVDWEAFGFDPPDTAENGRKAWNLYQAKNYDVVFTDIEMPVMNGMELIERIREEKPTQRVVIISCHEKFEYAQRAIKLGVEDYLIKDLLIKSELEAYVAEILNQDGKPLALAEDAPDIGYILRCAVTGAEEEAAVDKALPFPNAIVMTVLLDDFDELRPLRGETRLISDISAAITELAPPAHYYAGDDTVYLMTAIETVEPALYYYSGSIQIANTVRETARTHGFASVSIGVSNPISLVSAIQGACRQSLEAANMRVITGRNRTIIFNTIALKKTTLDFKQMEYLLDRIEAFSYTANPACFPLIDKLYAVQLPTSLADIHYYRYINASLWTLASSVARSMGLQFDQVFAAVNITPDQLSGLADSAEMRLVFRKCFLELFAHSDSPEDNSLVGQTLRLIDQEYMKDISLATIADRLHTNKSYLSRLFKKSTNENIMNMIKSKKIACAKHLLCDTQMKLYEISDSLAFATPQYFSIVFKQEVGVSPGEYRRLHETALDTAW